ncbi:uncharacterized protein EV420DRAFT_1641603 [Desarmillaria tabescens]|uniref:Alpha/beta-hydrolase n=1 Tax=Armillaria tabescens TaxID=1929756 RepID=A0AA39KHN2_ARMTA|nr:uncharacterized protein EV420DRAFT_1641603 [Desarmillaria tabescens]KAK0460260.1 hypothetical protein EV420DRAFT_1641603 [Desarmillaria tabescens]
MASYWLGRLPTPNFQRYSNKCLTAPSKGARILALNRRFFVVRQHLRKNSESHRRLGNCTRLLTLYEPALIALGLPTPKQNWTFLLDTSVPESLRPPAFGQWYTSFFDHADILDKLSWILASPYRVPTFFNDLPLSIQHYGEDAAGGPAIFDLLEANSGAYRKAFFDAEVFPSMKRSFVCGDKTGAFAIAALWAVQDDEKELRSANAKPVKYKIISGANHFVHICLLNLHPMVQTETPLLGALG